MLVAELEAFFSRPVAPTRRIAVGELRLAGVAPDDAVAMLLGGVVAAFGRRLDDDDVRELRRLIGDVEMGRRIPQPRLRHRFQRDRIGLKRSVSRLVQDRAGAFHLELDHDNGTSAQHSLAAVYCTLSLPEEDRRAEVFTALRHGLEWTGGLGPELLEVLRSGRPGPSVRAGVGLDAVGWALSTLGLRAVDGRPARPEVQRAFRDALRDAHPDHGGPLDGAAFRIAQLDAARRILLG